MACELIDNSLCNNIRSRCTNYFIKDNQIDLSRPRKCLLAAYWAAALNACACALSSPFRRMYNVYIHTYTVAYAYRGRTCIYVRGCTVYAARTTAEDAGYFAPHVYRYHLETRYGGTIFAECLLSQQTTFVPFLDATGCKNRRLGVCHY